MSIVLFVFVTGFVCAGLLNAIHKVVWVREDQQNQSAMVLYFDSPIAVAWSMLMCIFAGPYLVISNGIQFWREDILPVSALVLCGIVSALWSFCSGVFIVEAALGLGNMFI